MIKINNNNNYQCGFCDHFLPFPMVAEINSVYYECPSICDATANVSAICPNCKSVIFKKEIDIGDLTHCENFISKKEFSHLLVKQYKAEEDYKKETNEPYVKNRKLYVESDNILFNLTGIKLRQ